MDVCKLVDFLLVTEFPDGMEHWGRLGITLRQTGVWWDTRGGVRGAIAGIAGIADIARHRRDRNAHSTKIANAGCQDTVFDNLGSGSFGFNELYQPASTRSFGPTRKLKKALCSFTDLRMTNFSSQVKLILKLTQYHNLCTAKPTSENPGPG
jgi:hypothetical protein